MKLSKTLPLLLLTGLMLGACNKTGDLIDPTITLTATPETVTAAGAISLTAAATDNVGVSKVTFYRGTTELGSDDSAPYTYTDNVTSTQNGTLTYRAVASDAAGNTAEASDTVTVNIPSDNSGPTGDVTIVRNSSASYTVQVNASDASGISKVEVYDNGKLVATDTTAPYTAALTYDPSRNGTHTILIKIYDAAGNVTEITKTLTVNADFTAPTVSVSAQPSLLVASGTSTFTATASDNVGVTAVEFYDNGTLINTDTTAPYTASSSYTFANNGTHTIVAKAYDAEYNVSEASTVVTVAIADAYEPNDSIAAATALPIGTPINGAIAAQPRDMDYFKFTAAAGDMLKLMVKSTSVNPASTLDPYVTILMPDGVTVLEKDDDSGSALESEIRFNVVDAGTYTVVVTSFDIHDDDTATDDKATNTYQIALTRR